MTTSKLPIRRTLSLACGLLILAISPAAVPEEPTAAAIAAFNAYVVAFETRLEQQHQSESGFLAPGAADQQSEIRLRHGELIIEKIAPPSTTDSPGAMLQHWRGTAFVAGAKPADFERLMKNFNAYPKVFSPQVLKASALADKGDHFHATMRVRQVHVITVVMDTTYDISFAQLDAQHGYSLSRSTHIAEIDSPGTATERALSPAEQHGFLWRLNSYWSYEERDGGLYMQIESISLTRSIPRGLGWLVGPFVESVPRESLEFTLRSACNALRK